MSSRDVEPHAAFELSAFDRVSSPPRHQVKQGMASKQSEKGAPAIVFEDEEQQGPVSLESIDGRLQGMLEDTEADLKEVKDAMKATERNVVAYVAKTAASLTESIAEVAYKQHDSQVQIQNLQDSSRVTIKLLRQVMVKLETINKPSSEDIEAARAEGLKKGAANSEKYTKSLQTQLMNMKEKLTASETRVADLERKGRAAAVAAAGGGAEEAADYSLEDMAAAKAAKAEQAHKRKLEVNETKDEDYQPSAERPKISVKKPRNQANAASSSSSSAKPGACDKCFASKAAECVCDEDEEEEEDE